MAFTATTTTKGMFNIIDSLTANAPGGPLCLCQRSDEETWDERTATQSLSLLPVRAACQLCGQHQDAGGTWGLYAAAIQSRRTTSNSTYSDTMPHVERVPGDGTRTWAPQHIASPPAVQQVKEDRRATSSRVILRPVSAPADRNSKTPPFSLPRRHYCSWRSHPEQRWSARALDLSCLEWHGMVALVAGGTTMWARAFPGSRDRDRISSTRKPGDEDHPLVCMNGQRSRRRSFEIFTVPVLRTSHSAYTPNTAPSLAS
ncbi:hypothetical protein OIDMADRAFT_180985 [Oidiodendron maius Zn]|uniref:Uncharacterized protein n=1 Tax=Oidiodendron maius (strain Zn) TaxID=913774 RepID=A0A0C3DC79_OIDMZ|nr:hypothetical protein OIDMADRAFT_180985 [Oidiodendron maius Zn]